MALSSMGATTSSATSSGTSFTVPGLGGIDTTSMQAAMVAIAQQPITLLQSQQAQVTQKQTAWRTINSAVLALGTSATALSDTSLASSRSVRVSDSNVLTATASPGQSLGNYTVTVKALAQNHQLISGGYADKDSTPLGTGTINIAVGAASFQPITIDSSNNTLQGMADAINSAKHGVTASVVDSGSAAGDSRYKLMLVSNSTGTDGAITATMNLGSSSPTMSTLVDAQDAHIQLGTGSQAVDIYSSSNSISSAISGVTMQLQSTSATPVTVVLSQKTSQIQSDIQDLITNYNNLNGNFATQMSYDTTSQTAGGPLFGDPTLIGLQQQVAGLVTGSHNVDGAYSSLADLGITLDSSGNLQMSNPSALSSALASNPDDVIKLLQDSKQGIATQLNTMVTSYTDANSGILSQQDKSYTNQYDDLQTEIDSDTLMAKAEQDRITEMFTALQASLATLNSQSDYVKAQISAWNDTSSSE